MARDLTFGRCFWMLSKEVSEEVQRTYLLLLVLGSHSPGSASVGKQQGKRIRLSSVCV